MKRSMSVLVLALIVAVLGFASPALAVTTGSVKVTVLDETKEPLPGATVTLSDANKQHPDQTLETNVDGQVSFPIVQPGSSYLIAVQMAGYNRQVRSGIQVRSNTWTQVAVSLIPEKVEQVTVIGKDKVVELDADAQSKTEISAEAFADLPIFGKDYKAALPLAAGVQDSDGDGNPNVHGSRDRDFAMSVDGLSNVDPVSGRALSEINADSIEEIVIAQSGADASYGGAVGGYGKIITKSGGNDFTVSAELLLRDGTFDFDGASGGTSDRGKRRQPSASFSGPILKDKLFFRLDHQYLDIAQPIDVLGGQSFTQNFTQWSHSDKLTWNVNAKNKLNFLYRSDPATLEPGDVNTVTPPESGSTIEFSGPSFSLTWTAPFSASFLWEATLGLVDVDTKTTPYAPETRNTCINPSNSSLSHFGGYSCFDQVELDRVSGAYYLNNLNENRKISLLRLDAEQYLERWLGGSHKMKFGVELQQREFSRDMEISPVLQVGQPPLVGGVISGGGDTVQGGTNAYTMQMRAFYFPGRGTGEVVGDTFTPKSGFNNSIGDNAALYFSDTYEPAPNLSISIGARLMREELRSDGYRDMDPVAERARYDAGVNQCIVTPRDQGGCLESCDPQTGTPARCQGCLLRSCTTGVFASTALLTAHQLDDPAAYITYPTRCDGSVNPSICGRLLETTRYSTTPLAFRSAETFTIDNVDIDPRVSVSWDPWNDNKTRLAASYGRYTQNTYLEPLVSENGPDLLDKSYGLDVDSETGAVDFTDPNSLFNSQLGQSAFGVRMVDRDLAREYQNEYQISIEREIAPETSLQLSYIRRKYENQLQDTDINHTPITYQDQANRFTPDFIIPAGQDCPLVNGYYDCGGQEFIYQDLGGGVGGENPVYNVSNYPDGLADLKVVNPLFNNIYSIGNYNSSDYTAYTLELTRRFFNSWELAASYTWSRAEGQAEDFSGAAGNDVTNKDDEQGLLSFDQTHVVKVYGRVQVPYFGGFRLAANASYMSGLPYSIYEIRPVLDFPDDYFSGAMNDDTQPRLSGYGDQFRTNRTIYPTGERNDQRNPAYWTFDVNVQKEFQFKSVKATTTFKVLNILDDDSYNIYGVQRILAGVDPATNSKVYRDVPIAARRYGRQFELGLRFNWGG